MNTELKEERIKYANELIGIVKIDGKIPDFLTDLVKNEDFLNKEGSIEIIEKIVEKALVIEFYTSREETIEDMKNFARIVANPHMIKNKNYYDFVNLIFGLEEGLQIKIVTKLITNPSFWEREDALDLCVYIQNKKDFTAWETYCIPGNIADVITCDNFLKLENKFEVLDMSLDARNAYVARIFLIKEQIKEEHFNYILEKIIKCKSSMSGRFIYDFVKKYDSIGIPKYLEIIEIISKTCIYDYSEMTYLETVEAIDSFLDFFVKRKDLAEILPVFLDEGYLRLNDLIQFTKYTIDFEKECEDWINQPKKSFNKHYTEIIKLIANSTSIRNWKDGEEKDGYKVRSAWNVVNLALETEIFQYDNWYDVLEKVSDDCTDETYKKVVNILNKSKKNQNNYGKITEGNISDILEYHNQKNTLRKLKKITKPPKFYW